LIDAYRRKGFPAANSGLLRWRARDFSGEIAQIIRNGGKQMFLEKIKSPGIAHLSYILGDGNEAVVIDPRRDCDVYCDIASHEGVNIKHIFETHRNEDYVIGSLDLARKTGADIHHGSQLDFEYGNSVAEGDVFSVGGLNLSIMKTPGHTMESISIVVTDQNFGAKPVGVFTGDALFVGDVGRTDFFPDRKEEVAGMLYDSIFHKLLPLGDQTLLWPAHGAGSVCGDGMADREFSTLGYEKGNNPALKKTDRDEFIQYKVAEKHKQPSYFRKMEDYNLNGAPPLPERLPGDVPMSADAVAGAVQTGAILIDLRSPEAFAGAFIPEALAIPVNMLPAYGGYFLPYDQDLILIPETHKQVVEAVRHLVRMGYDRVVGYLKGGMHAWEVSGRKYGRIPAVHAADLEERMQSDETLMLLDVRKETEFKAARLPGAKHIFLGDLPERLNELPKDRPIVTFCGSGRRAIIAASILARNGFERVEDSLGSMMACKQLGCEIEEG
jgi:hydroxyacylglutathione hydrolase